LVFEKQFPDYFTLKYNKKTAIVQQISNLLDKKTAMISYFVTDSLLTVFTITQKTFHVTQIPTPINFSDTIAYYRYFIRSFDTPSFDKNYRDFAFRLYKLLIPQNLDKRLKNLIIIPDRELAVIPFETLLYENPATSKYSDLPYLVKKYNISYSYSATLFERTFPKEKQKNLEVTQLNDWLALAPVFPDSKKTGISLASRHFMDNLSALDTDTTLNRAVSLSGKYIPPLYGTEKEVLSIFDQFKKHKLKATVKLYDKASEGFIKSDSVSNYRFIHFATHGFVNSEKPELSGILLAQVTDSIQSPSDQNGLGGFQSNKDQNDGIMYSGELFNLKLNADLVVLSACETGLGKMKKGEGIIGLTRALLYAGTKNILVSLWPVSDESTADLMINFYSHLLKNRPTHFKSITFSAPLRKAKLKMIKEGKFSHPFFWSPFILVGN
jgi:CHAT domain-containing protein